MYELPNLLTVILLHVGILYIRSISYMYFT